jgi:flagellar assembly protein FliH
LSKIIRAESGAHFDAWQVPSVDGSAAQELKGAGASASHLLTARQVEALQSGAHKEAYDKGFAEGLAGGAAQIAAHTQRLDELIRALSRPFDELDAVIEEEVLMLAKVLAQHILRRELKTDTGHIIGAVRDCIKVLPSAARNVIVHLNPEDAALVRQHLASSDGERRWRLEDDPLLERGALRVSSDTSQIDGSLSSRLNEIVAAALGTGRAGDGGR